MSIFWEPRAFNAFPLISQPPSETGGIIASMSSDLPRITQLGKDQVRVESPELSAPSPVRISLRSSGSMGYAGWRSSEPLLPEEEEPRVQVALTRVSPVFLGRRWGRLWWAFLAGMWEVAGDKSRGWAQRDQTQVLTVGGCSYLSQKPGSHSFVHSFIHSFLEKYIKHIELLRHIIHSHHKLVLKV